MVARIYTPEMKQWLRDNVQGRSLKQLTEDFNNHFGTNVLESRIAHLKGDMRLRNGNDTRFVKGQAPTNKGQKMSDAQRLKLQDKWFQKGHKPKNYREIGSEYIDTDGYIQVKITDNKWLHKQRLVWEQHNGPIPKGYAVMFLDGNVKNCDIENLRLIKRATLTRLSLYKMRSKIPEATEAGIKIVEILDEISKKEKEKL